MNPSTKYSFAQKKDLYKKVELKKKAALAAAAEKKAA